ncbi:hypothetical protein CHS0354_016864 [Potamilus streckersoni]|uniref:Uncharacterized protein n=1 Tax=Potamilus streckersoni TaxID=2493646 RepID=A0AAE0S830_9BIVA|nr:hypothetical protein CHS0354_016864 [Potamilus streckersoni]
MTRSEVQPYSFKDDQCLIERRAIESGFALRMYSGCFTSFSTRIHRFYTKFANVRKGREGCLQNLHLYICGTRRGIFTSYGDYVDLIRDRTHHAHQVSRKHLQSAERHQKELYDAMVSQQTCQPGYLVWLIAGSRKIDVSPKLQNMYDGIYVVKRATRCLIIRSSWIHIGVKNVKVPYYSNLCNFRCTQQRDIERNVRHYPDHKVAVRKLMERGQSIDQTHEESSSIENTEPYQWTEEILILNKEESELVWREREVMM